MRHSESGRRPGGVAEVRVYRVEVSDEGSPTSIPTTPAQAGPFSESGRGL